MLVVEARDIADAVGLELDNEYDIDRPSRKMRTQPCDSCGRNHPGYMACQESSMEVTV
jgi:hypothetical protein